MKRPSSPPSYPRGRQPPPRRSADLPTGVLIGIPLVMVALVVIVLGFVTRGFGLLRTATPLPATPTALFTATATRPAATPTPAALLPSPTPTRVSATLPVTGNLMLEGGFFSPLEGEKFQCVVPLEAWVADKQGGIKNVRIMARWNLNISIFDLEAPPYKVEWNMCDSHIPDGLVELDLVITGQSGREYRRSAYQPMIKITKAAPQPTK